MNEAWTLPPLTDGEISLQPVAAGDAEELFAIIDRDRLYLREWLPWVDGTRVVADTRAFIVGAEKQFGNKTGLVVCIRIHGQIAGVVGFNFFDWSKRSTLVGYWLAQDQQGRGVMTRSCALLVKFAFTELALQRVEIRCAAGNKKSRAIPERLGFKNEGTMQNGERLNGKLVDLIIYGISN